MAEIFLTQSRDAIALELLTAEEIEPRINAASEAEGRWLGSNRLASESGSWLAVPAADGSLGRVLVVVDPQDPISAVAGLSQAVPMGCYALDRMPPGMDAHIVALGWGLGAYQFTRYKAAKRAPAQLLVPQGTQAEALVRELRAVDLVRDLINTPTEDMGPKQLAERAQSLAEEYGAQYSEIVGDELLQQNFPAIHAVGRASHRAPRLIELNWGKPGDPRVTLVGKGVCFDTGGLDLKTAVGMQLMKKDMGGAAHVLGLAQMVMAAKLPIRLQMLVSAVENAVGPDSYRPGDIIPTRAGLSVEIGNTDAEGRVVLSDALTYGCESSPEVIMDFATLTGAARVALGTDLPALFANQDELAEGLLAGGLKVSDPLWRMPLHAPYRRLIEPNHAHLNNSGVGRFGGAITAALFLQSFVKPQIPWCHIDTYGWNDRVRPGRPVGGDALGMRAAFHYLQARFA